MTWQRVAVLAIMLVCATLIAILAPQLRDAVIALISGAIGLAVPAKPPVQGFRDPDDPRT